MNLRKDSKPKLALSSDAGFLTISRNIKTLYIYIGKKKKVKVEYPDDD